MDYDGLIDELYNICREYENQITGEKEADLVYLQRLYALNFEVRKNGVKGLCDSDSIVLDDDVRIEFQSILSTLSRLSDSSPFTNVSLHLDTLREKLQNEGIDGLKPL